MKMRLVALLWGLVLLACPCACGAEALGELIEPLPAGHINWTRGVVVAQSTDSLEHAIGNILQTVVQVRLDDENNVQDRIASAPKMWAEVKAMAVASEILARENRPNGGKCLTIQMSLFGGFAQLILPTEIKQVEPIKPLNGAHSSNDNHRADAGVAMTDRPDEASEYTGLIVDARDTGVKPAMVPVVLDESGKEVYSSAFVSREFAVQHGVCQYVPHAQGLIGSPRVGPKPLLVRGLRTAENGRCNIIVSNADASRLHSSSTNLKFLKECRVIIVID